MRANKLRITSVATDAIGWAHHTLDFLVCPVDFKEIAEASNNEEAS